MASIAAVSRVEMMTRAADALEGTRYVIHGGEEQECTSAGCPVGTTLIARDLFYNTPARMKFLKKDVSEANSVAAVVEKAALAHPEVSFKLIRDNQVRLLTPGDGKLLSAIHAALGKEAAASMIPVDYEAFGMKIKGYICKPTESRGNRTMQNFFINGRFVHSKTMMAALEEAYRHSIMVGKFPSCVLDLQAPFQETDVNVHPAKIEVRFANEKSVFDVVYYGVKSALGKYDYSLKLQEEPTVSKTVEAEVKQPKLPERMTADEYRKAFSAAVTSPKTPQLSQIPQAENKYTNNIHQYTDNARKNSGLQGVNPAKASLDSQNVNITKRELSLADGGTPYEIKKSAAQIPMSDWTDELPKCMEGKASREETLLKDVKEEPIPSQTEIAGSQPVAEIQCVEPSKPLELHHEEQQDHFALVRIIGELFGTYILLENKDELILIDKHAAHERLIFEQLKKLDLSQDRQMLLAPILIHLSREDYSAVCENTQVFEQIGFEVEDFGGGDLYVRAVPVALPECDVRDVVEETAHKISLNHRDLTPDIVNELLHNIACRSAIKAHDKNTTLELEQIVSMLRENEDVKYCPHGRPIARTLTKKDLEKMFGRIQ